MLSPLAKLASTKNAGSWADCQFQSGNEDRRILANKLILEFKAKFKLIFHRKTFRSKLILLTFLSFTKYRIKMSLIFNQPSFGIE